MYLGWKRPGPDTHNRKKGVQLPGSLILDQASYLMRTKLVAALRTHVPTCKRRRFRRMTAPMEDGASCFIQCGHTGFEPGRNGYTMHEGGPIHDGASIRNGGLDHHLICSCDSPYLYLTEGSMHLCIALRKKLQLDQLRAADPHALRTQHIRQATLATQKIRYTQISLCSISTVNG